MAKRRPEQTDKSKMTFLMFQLEGDDSTLREGFQTMSKAIARMHGQKFVYGALPAAAKNDNETADFDALDEPDATDDLNEVESEGDGTLRSKPRIKRSIKSPKILEIELTAGDKPLKGFLDELSPNGVNKRYLACAYWLKTYRDIREVTMDHIHTCFRHMGWQTPNDATQPLRDCKKNDWFGKGSQKGSYAINHIGDNVIIGSTQAGE